eukprot:scaffold8334_cov59-Phaeocystis_antarctica.AAC.3
MILAVRIFSQSAPGWFSPVHTLFSQVGPFCRGGGCKVSQTRAVTEEGEEGDEEDGEEDEEGPEFDSSGDEIPMPVKRRRP